MNINMNQTTRYVIPDRCEDCQFSYWKDLGRVLFCKLFNEIVGRQIDDIKKCPSCHSSDGVFETRAIEVNVSYDVRPVKQGE